MVVVVLLIAPKARVVVVVLLIAPKARVVVVVVLIAPKTRVVLVVVLIAPKTRVVLVVIASSVSVEVAGIQWVVVVLCYMFGVCGGSWRCFVCRGGVGRL